MASTKFALEPLQRNDKFSAGLHVITIKLHTAQTMYSREGLRRSGKYFNILVERQLRISLGNTGQKIKRHGNTTNKKGYESNSKLNLIFYYTNHSRPQRPRSFWSAPRIATSGQVQRHSGFEWICKHNRLRPEPIRFVRLDSEHAQSDGKSVNRGLPLLDTARGRDSWC